MRSAALITVLSTTVKVVLAGDGDGDSGVTHSPAADLPCLQPSQCHCACGWKPANPVGTCRNSQGATCMLPHDPSLEVNSPHMQRVSLDECKKGCERNAKCVAVDHATYGDQRCWFYSECPHPNAINSASLHHASYYGHRTVCADHPHPSYCDKTHAPVDGLQALVGQTLDFCGSNAGVMASFSSVTIVVDNVFDIKVTNVGKCSDINSGGCKTDVETKVAAAAGVSPSQVDAVLTNAGGCTSGRKASTQSSEAEWRVTISAPAVPSVSGDPFVSFGDKKTQIYLPVGQLRTLIKCQDMELFGRVMDNGVAANDQWFDMFKLTIKGTEIISVMVNSTIEATQFQQKDEVQAPVTGAKDRVANLLNKINKENADPALLVAKNLTSINVDVMGRAHLTTGGPITSGVKVRIEQDTAKPIGQGFSESVSLEPGAGSGSDFSLKISSSVAHKYAYTNGKLAVHLDLEFLSLDGNVCQGVLPQVWGLSPMTKNTAKLLEPPVKN